MRQMLHALFVLFLLNWPTVPDGRPSEARLQVAHADPLVLGETFTITSKALGESRRINVYAPPEYTRAHDLALPVLYMPDGGVAENFIQTQKAIVGESLAGLFVIETLLQEPELFDTYIAFDPSLWWNDQKLLARAPDVLRRAPLGGKTLFVASSGEPGMVDRTGGVDLAGRANAAGETLHHLSPRRPARVPSGLQAQGLTAGYDRPGSAVIVDISALRIVPPTVSTT